MKKLIVIAVLLLSSVVGKAQEFKLSPYTQYLIENPFIISPAYAGMNNMQRLRLSGAFQWVGLQGAPNTQVLSYDTPMFETSGAGGVLYNDRNGNTSQIGGQLSLAHHLIIDDVEEHYISFGLSYKFVQFKIDVSDFDNPNDDPNIGSNVSSFNSNFDAAFLYRIKQYYISFNASNILDKSVKAFDDTEPRKLRNYYIYTGYVFELNDSEIELEPSLYFKYFESDQRSITDFNIKAKRINYDGSYYWVGISTRFLNDQSFKPLAIVPMVGMKKSDFYVGFAYQYNINQAIGLNYAGTYLLTLGYDFESKNGGKGTTRW
ncbi:MAG: type IX secretion system membrane protein PorP/SprF [Flavobacteriaceae bacterium]|nr:type IX secretion system membrane protein PorP/SprF [Flavobacteriaceae bacterium]